VIHLKFKNWFEIFLKNKLEENGYELKYISGKDSNFGELFGVQIESEKKGGHLYFWNSGFYNYHLYDFIQDLDLVKDTHGNYKGEDLEVLLEDFLPHLI